MDVSKAKANLSQLNGEIKRTTTDVKTMQNQMKDLKVRYDDSGIAKMKADFEKAKENAAILEARMNSIGKKQKASPELEAITAKTAQLYKELNKNQGSVERYNQIKTELEELGRQEAKLKASGGAYTDSTRTDEYIDAARDYRAAVEELTRAEQAIADAESALGGNFEAQMAELQNGVSGKQAYLQQLKGAKVGAEANVDTTNSISKVVSDLQAVESTARKAFGSVVSAAAKTGRSIGLHLKSGLERVVGGLKSVISFSKRGNNAIGALGKRILGLASGALVFSQLSKAFSSLTTGIGDSMTTYLGYDTSLRNSINAMKQSLASLSGSFVSAFAPILSVVVPIITTLINYCVAGMNAIAQFFAVLTGHSTYKVASVSLDGVAGSAGSAGSALGDAADNAKKLKKELAHYDMLNVISKDDGSTSNGSGGSGGGGASGGAAGLTYSDGQVLNSVSDFAEKCKEAWKNTDFTEVGQIIGTKLDGALRSIPWADIQKTAGKIGKSIATLINGGVSVTGLQTSIGYTIGQALNTILTGLDAFVGNLNWSAVGSFIGSNVASAINTINWSMYKNLCTNFGSGIADFLNGLLTKKTLKSVGKGVGTTLSGLIGGASSFLAKADFAGWGGAITSFVTSSIGAITSDHESIKTNCKKFAASLAKGLDNVMTADTFSSIASLFANAVIVDVEGAYTFFVTSPPNWSKWGESIASGLTKYFRTLNSAGAWTKAGLTLGGAINGILELLNKVVTETNWKSFGEGIREMLKAIDWKEVLKNIGRLIWNAIKAGWDTLKEVMDGDPIEAAIVAGVGILTFTGLGSVILGKIATSILGAVGGSLATSSLGAAFASVFSGLAPIAAVAFGGIVIGLIIFELAKHWDEINSWVGKKLDAIQERMGSKLSMLTEETNSQGETFIDDTAYGGSAGVAAQGFDNADGNYPVDNFVKGIGKGVVNWFKSNPITGIKAEASEVSAKKGIKPTLITGAVNAVKDSLTAKQRALKNWTAYVKGVNKDDLTEDDTTLNTAAQISKVIQPVNQTTITNGAVEIKKAIDATNGSARLDKATANVTKMADFMTEDKKVLNKMTGNVSKAVDKTNGSGVIDKATAKATKFTDSIGGKAVVDNSTAKATKFTDGTGGKAVVGAATAKVTKFTDGTNGTAVVDKATAKATKFTDATNGTAGVGGVTAYANKFSDATNGTAAVGGVTAYANKFADSTGGNGTVSGVTAKATKFQDATSGGSVSVAGKLTSIKDDIAAGKKKIDNVTAKITSLKKGSVSIALSGAVTIAKKIASLVLSKHGGAFGSNYYQSFPSLLAGGGAPLHGTAFIAGEAGAEIVGNIGSRTEVLNRSQIAMAVYQAVANAIRANITGLVNPLANALGNLSYGYQMSDQSRYNAIADAINSSNMAKVSDLQQMVMGGNYTFVAELDGQTIFNKTVSMNDLFISQTGKSAFAQ